VPRPVLLLRRSAESTLGGPGVLARLEPARRWLALASSTGWAAGCFVRCKGVVTSLCAAAAAAGRAAVTPAGTSGRAWMAGHRRQDDTAVRMPAETAEARCDRRDTPRAGCPGICDLEHDATASTGSRRGPETIGPLGGRAAGPRCRVGGDPRGLGAVVQPGRDELTGRDYTAVESL